jgi:hypothetical protein
MLGKRRRREADLETLDALRAIARLVKGVPGQKNLLWLSAGFPLRLDGPGAPGAESFHDDASLTTRELSAANVTIYPIDARGLALSSRAYLNIGTMRELANRPAGRRTTTPTIWHPWRTRRWRTREKAMS